MDGSGRFVSSPGTNSSEQYFNFASPRFISLSAVASRLFKPPVQVKVEGQEEPAPNFATSASYIASSTTVYIAPSSASFIASTTTIYIASGQEKSSKSKKKKKKSKASSSKPSQEKDAKTQGKEKSKAESLPTFEEFLAQEKAREESIEAKKDRLLKEWHAKAIIFFRNNRLIYGALVATTNASGRIFRRVYNNFQFLFPVISADGKKMYPIYSRVFTDSDLVSLSDQILDQWEFHHDFIGPISKPALDLLKMSQPLINMSQKGIEIKK